MPRTSSTKRTFSCPPTLILFFGTPHQGSDITSWGKLALRVSRIYYETDDRLVQHLNSQSESIETGLGNFASLATSIKTKYFYETLPTPIIGGRSIMVSHRVFQTSITYRYRLSTNHPQFLRRQMLRRLTRDDTISTWSNLRQKPIIYTKQSCDI